MFSCAVAYGQLALLGELGCNLLGLLTEFSDSSLDFQLRLNAHISKHPRQTINARLRRGAFNPQRVKLCVYFQDMVVVISDNITNDIEAREARELIAAVQMKKGTIDLVLVEIAIPQQITDG